MKTLFKTIAFVFALVLTTNYASAQHPHKRKMMDKKKIIEIEKKM